MTNEQIRMATVFNEWARLYSEDPDSFTDILDSNGKPVEDYGECAAIYFIKLEKEMEEEGKL